MKRRIAVLLVLGILPWAGLYAQQTAQTTFRVSATVNAVCAITASDLAFGTYTAQSGTPLLGTTALRATCTPETTYNIGFNEGTSPGATVNTRQNGLGSEQPQLSTLFRRGSQHDLGQYAGTDTVTGVGTGMAVDHTVYGTVPAAQNIPAGIYGDTITVRIYY